MGDRFSDLATGGGRARNLRGQSKRKRLLSTCEEFNGLARGGRFRKLKRMMRFEAQGKNDPVNFSGSEKEHFGGEESGWSQGSK